MLTYFPLQQELDNSVKLLEDFKNGTLPDGVTDEQLWKAQKRKQVGL